MRLSSDYSATKAQELAESGNFAPSLQDVTWPEGSKLTYTGRRSLKDSDFDILSFENLKDQKVYEIIDFAFFGSIDPKQVDEINNADNLLISDNDVVEVKDGEIKPYHVQFESLKKVDGEWIVNPEVEPILKRKIKVTAATA